MLTLSIAMLPTQALATPPDPASAEVPRDDVPLEELPDEQLVTGTNVEAKLGKIGLSAPANQDRAPAGTTTPATSGTEPVDFGSATSTAALQTGSAVTQAAYKPAGSLPVKLGQAPDAAAPTGSWSVTVSPRTAPVSTGVDGAVVSVTAPATGSVPISVQLSYKTFENLYGADWASRLHFVQFPECYLTTPDLEECQAYTELDTDNDTSAKTITATVDTAADGTVSSASASAAPAASSGVIQASYTQAQPAAATGDKAVIGAVDSGGSAGGSFKATPLASSGKWAAGTSSGAFTWSYPITVPPAPAGPAPQIAFGYNSQTVDGKTATSSPQVSWIGEGWDYDPGHIERRYRSCKDDRDDVTDGAANNKEKKYKTSDLCWVSYNAVMSLGGRTVELVRASSTSEIYRPQNDDGTRVELKTGGDNKDDNGEYWLVTTPDGTKYYFGQNKVGGSHADTDSVFTVPVYGNHPGEPCRQAAFADSRCSQAWHWGLDKVVDVNDNAMIVNWKRETNYYAANKKFKTPVSYDRGGYPLSIEYGLRTSDLNSPSARVLFNAQQRCLQADGSCAAAKFDVTDDPASYQPWWDSPGNLNCKSTSKLCPAFPSFWTRIRLASVTTEAARPGTPGLTKVDTYTLRQSFPRDWYDTSPALWLNSITRTGFAPGDTTGTVMSADGVSFAPYTVASQGEPLSGHYNDSHLPNLVPRSKNDARPGFIRPRIGNVRTEQGGSIAVRYTGGCRTQPTVSPENNDGTCYPVRWSPDGEVETPKIAWFNKYVVDTVIETDRISGVSDAMVTKYTYKNPAWGKDDDEFSKPSLRTYGVWRGYQQVETAEGAENGGATAGVTQTQSYSVVRYFRGAGGAVKDSKGEVTLLADDAPQYAGMVAETISYTGTGGPAVKRILNYPWSKQTASRTRDNDTSPLLAHRTGVRRTDAIQKVSDSWQAVRTETEVDPDHGLPVQVQTSVVKPGSGGAETFSEYRCTRTEYANNVTAANIIGLPKQVRTTATSCAAHDSADPATQLISATRTSYDSLTYGAVPVRGLPTSVASNPASGSGYSVVTTSTYDDLGRIRIVTAPDSVGVVKTETQYTPASGGPVTAVKTINPAGHTSLTTFDPGRGLPLTVTDANNRVTRTEYDALGRLVNGWSAARSSGNQTPNVKITYQMAKATDSVTKPSTVTVETLRDNGTYARQTTIYDGLSRPFQTQAEAHGRGRVITDTRYDDHGLVREQTGGYLVQGEPQATQFKRKSDSLVPTMNRTVYDGLERPIKTTTLHSGKAVYSNSATYGDDWTLTSPAGGATPPVKTSTDALGRVTLVQHYTDSGLSHWRSTRYSYDARGNRQQVKDPAGNVWTYNYDSRGRMTDSTDPDVGTSSFTYDDLDRRKSATDSRNLTTFTDYDVTGRVKAVREGSATASPIIEYAYDPTGALGQLSSTTRHDRTGDYVDRITGYDTDYHPTGREVTIPDGAATAGLAGKYAYAYTYTPTGKPLTATLPAVGGLAKEKVVTRYDSDGLAESTSGLSWYTSDVTYSPYGEVLRTVSGPQPYRVWTTNFVDEHTGRVQRSVWDRETDASHRITDAYFSYDRAGNVTSAARQQMDGTVGTTDNQCFTYDQLGELVHAWTSNVAIDTVASGGKGCRSASGTNWGYRADGQTSAGPIAEAADSATDTTAPDSDLTASLSRTAPASGTVSTGSTAYWDAYTFDVTGNRTSLTEHASGATAATATTAYGYGTTNTTTRPHLLTSRTVTKPNTTPVTSSYAYDAAGNTTARPGAVTGQSLVWTAQGKLATASDGNENPAAITGLGGFCLDVRNAATADGTVIQISTCNSGDAQKWTLGLGGQLKALGKCATAVGTADSGAVQLSTCNSSDAQKWTLGANGSLKNTASARCLDIPGSSPASGTALQIATCANSTDQRWTLTDRTDYVYDASGNRLLERTKSGATLFLGETEVTTNTAGTITRAVRAYAHPGAPTVVRTTAGTATGHKLTILLNDPLGTATTAVEESAGQPLTRRAFKPYGESRGTPATAWPNRHTYLGVGIDDTATTGLTHIGAREYDQSTGRFVSADPIMDIADPLQMNGYAYSNNSPVSHSDPTGLWIDDGTGHSESRGGPSGSESTASDDAAGGNGSGSGGNTTGAERNGGRTNLGNCLSMQSNAHDAAVCTTGFAAASWAQKNGIAGYVTVDVGTGGRDANMIPGAKADGLGGKGHADVIFWANGEVYIWEVKPNASKFATNSKQHQYSFVKGPEQLARYINKLETFLEGQGDDRVVDAGPALSSGSFMYRVNKKGRVWSDQDYAGMRYYGTDSDRRRQGSAVPSPSPGASPNAEVIPRTSSHPNPGPSPSNTGFYETLPPGQGAFWGTETAQILSAFGGFAMMTPVGHGIGAGATILYELAA
ncbi:ricin-type beta-trefoil lectin domain protein [Streptomyces lacrimifluminis]|uniref:ricin-type beta-trefoil lectin domain protein n=1 Tax=Streptomyces lacrimifluminis TaxID=1500077 RepID=UPI001669A4A5|nr:ricin-type beta-trefoil lectin domain protein [Streptomyces lacrimifluminis]